MTQIPLIAGLTASGKSELALQLALAVDGEIVSADAMQVYRGFDLGTAKPDAKTQRLVKHHLIDVAQPGDRYNVARFVRDAELAIGDILKRGRLPIVCGGSMLYTSALLEGRRFPGPVSEATRVGVAERFAEEGAQALWQEIKRLDPESGARLSPADHKRILRFFEDYTETGLTRSQLNRRSREGRPAFRFQTLCLMPDQAWIAPRIRARTEAMFAAGLLEEVRQLMHLYPDQLETEPFRAIGYRAALAHLQGRLTLEETRERTVVDTRRFAKRQRTWYRHQEGYTAFDPSGGLPDLPFLIRHFQLEERKPAKSPF